MDSRTGLELPLRTVASFLLLVPSHHLTGDVKASSSFSIFSTLEIPVYAHSCHTSLDWLVFLFVFPSMFIGFSDTTALSSLTAFPRSAPPPFSGPFPQLDSNTHFQMSDSKASQNLLFGALSL